MATPPLDCAARLYFLALRTRETPIPERERGGGTVENIDYLVKRVVRERNYVGDRNGPVKETLAAVLSKLTVLWREVTQRTGKYFP